MFILSAILLEDRENLFQDFWSPFSISFISFSIPRLFKKKVSRLTGSCPTRTLYPAGPLKVVARPRRQPVPPPRENPSTVAPICRRCPDPSSPPLIRTDATTPPPPRRLACRHRRRRPPPPPELPPITVAHPARRHRSRRRSFPPR